MMRFTDEQIVAYVDGEAPRDLTGQIAAALDEDGELAARVRAMRQSRDWLHERLEVTDDEPLPEALLEMLDARPAPARRRWLPPLALAAALALVAVLFTLPHDGGPAWQHAGFVQTALESRLSGEWLSGEIDGVPAEIMPTATWVMPGGGICREFELQAGDGSETGLACREDGGWRVRALATAADAASPTEDYRPAGGEGAPLVPPGAEQLRPSVERRLVESGWRE